MLKPEEIKDLILDHSPIKRHAMENRNLYEGKLPIYTDKMHEGKSKIGTRFHTKIVNEFTGYFAGKPTTIQHTTDDLLQEHLDQIMFNNNIGYLQRQLTTDAAIAGAAYLMLYQNDEGLTKFYILERENVIVVKDNLTGEMEQAIRYYYLRDGHKERLRAELYTKDGLIYYYMETDGGKFVLDYSRANNPDSHSFKGIPIIEFAFNRYMLSLIDGIKDHAKKFDSILSYAADENEDIRNVIAVLKAGTGIADGEFAVMLQSRMVELDSTGDFEFKSKDPKTEPMERFLDRLERLMYESAQVVNMSDKDFTAAQSGLAILLKTFSMNNLAKSVEDEFKQAYHNLLKAIEPVVAAKMLDQSILDKNRKPMYKLNQFDIQFKRNMPITMIQTAKDLVDIKSLDMIDDETILSLMDFIADPVAILEKKEAQDKERMGIDYLDLHEED